MGARNKRDHTAGSSRHSWHSKPLWIATFVVGFSAALTFACSSADFGNSSTKKGSSLNTPTKSDASTPDPENASVTEPQSVAGMYLVSCGPSDVPLGDVPSGKAPVGCGVYEKTTGIKLTQQLSFDVVSFHDDQGHTETVTSNEFSPAPVGSRFHYLTTVSKDMSLNLKQVVGTITVEKKKYAGDFAVEDDQGGVDSPKNPQPCSRAISGSVEGLSVIYPTALDSWHRPPSYLIDGDINNIWNLGGYTGMVVKLKWTDPSQICAVNIFPDYGYKDANNQPVNTGTIDLKVEIGSSFDDSTAALKDPFVVSSHTGLPVERLKKIPLTYANWPKAGAMQITVNNCNPSWCAIGDINVLK